MYIEHVQDFFCFRLALSNLTNVLNSAWLSALDLSSQRLRRFIN